MTTIRRHTIVGNDGKITVPVGIEDAGEAVEVVVIPLRPKVTQEEYQAIIARTAGSIDDPTFVRPPQWELSEREPIE